MYKQQSLSGIFLFHSGSFCLNEPDAAFLGFAKLSFIFKNLFFYKNFTSNFNFIWKVFEFFLLGISLIVFKFSVIISPIFPSPLETA